jgi:hypothetical protein
MMVGLLYMEHGLAKLLGFPLQPNHAPYALFTLNPGLQGLLELVGGLLLALGWFTRHCRLCPRGQHGGRLFHAACAKRFPSAAQRRGVGNRLLLLLCLSGRRRGRMVVKPCLDGLGCHPFRDLPGSRGFPSIIGCRLGPCFSAPSPKKRLLPFNFGLPRGSAVVFRLQAFTRHYHSALQPYIWILPGNFAPFGGKASAEPGVRTSQGFSVSLAQP